MPFSRQVILDLGYAPIAAGTEVTAAFHSLHVYQVLGLTTDQDAIAVARGAVADTPYELALGSSVNALTKKLMGSSLVDDEAEWAKKHECNPPYAVAHIGPSPLHTASAGFVKQEGEAIHTYDTFTLAKSELRQVEVRVLPAVLTALHCSFSSPSLPVRFKHVDRAAFGRTPSGTVVYDQRAEIVATGTVSKRIITSELESGVLNSVAAASKLRAESAKFFAMGVAEKDSLRQFLFFFLSIEVETNAAYREVDRRACLSRLHEASVPVKATATELLAERAGPRVALAQKFAWCAICKWVGIADSEVAEFKRMKKIRDDIAHGVRSEPPIDAVRAVEMLATKLQTLCAASPPQTTAE